MTGSWITITVVPTKPAKPGIKTIRVGWFGFCEVALESTDGTIDVWVREKDLRRYLRDYVFGKEKVASE